MNVFNLSNAGDSSGMGKSDLRWVAYLDPSKVAQAARSLHLGIAVRPNQWPDEVVIDATSDGPLEDMPWTSWFHVVSDRLKEFLSSELLGVVQFLPLQIHFKQRPVSDRPFWVANWLQVVDCVDVERSVWGKRPIEEPSLGVVPHITLPFIRRSSIPASATVFRVAMHESYVLITDAFKQSLCREGFTGLQFYSVDQ